MLRRLGPGCFDGRIILFRWPPSTPGLRQRSVHHVATSGVRRSVSPPVAGKEPSWVMLNSYGVAIRTEQESSVADRPDPNTVAYSCTSTGQFLRASFVRMPPPASSFLYYDWLDSTAVEEEEEEEEEEPYYFHDYDEYMYISAIAAHEDAVLLEMSNRRGLSHLVNHFVYIVGTAGPPSLSLLPAQYFPTKTVLGPKMHGGNTGLLKRGKNDLQVVQIRLKYDPDARRDTAEFCVLRHGTSQWVLKEAVPIVEDEPGKGHKLQRSGTSVIPVGDRFLCWVNYETGFFLCDMGDEASPKVRHVRLPPDVIRCSDGYYDYDPDIYSAKFSRNMGAAGTNAVRFVSVDPHCCCGGPGWSTLDDSPYAFTINTWTMNLGMEEPEPLRWVKDGEMHCEELWTLPGYESLPRANVRCPVVSLDNPNVVCFLVSNYHITRRQDATVWMIQLNVKTKTLLSVVKVITDPWRAYYHLPAKLQFC